MKALLAGDKVRARTTILLKPRIHVAIKGQTYHVRAVKEGCCGQLVDIGYDHFALVVNICSKCRRRREEKSPLWIPATHFRSIPSGGDALQRKIDDLERDFVYLDLSR